MPAVLCSLLLGLSLFFFARPNDQDAEQQAGMRLLNTDAMDGQAEVFRYGQHVGKTPLQLREHQGDHISLLLKRPGHADLPLDFDVTDRTSYTYVLKPLLGTVP